VASVRQHGIGATQDAWIGADENNQSWHRRLKGRTGAEAGRTRRPAVASRRLCNEEQERVRLRARSDLAPDLDCSAISRPTAAALSTATFRFCRRYYNLRSGTRQLLSTPARNDTIRLTQIVRPSRSRREYSGIQLVPNMVLAPTWIPTPSRWS